MKIESMTSILISHVFVRFDCGIWFGDLDIRLDG